jgi:hypothetical protein
MGTPSHGCLAEHVPGSRDIWDFRTRKILLGVNWKVPPGEAKFCRSFEEEVTKGQPRNVRSGSIGVEQGRLIGAWEVLRSLH